MINIRDVTRECIFSAVKPCVEIEVYALPTQ